MLLSLLLFEACESPPPLPPPAPTTLAPLAMEAAGGGPVWRALSELNSGSYELPADNLAPSGPAQDSYPIPGPWRKTGKISGFQLWNHPMPFKVDMPRPNYAPFGSRLVEQTRKGLEEIPYVNDGGDIKGGGWLVDRGELRLLSDKDPTGRTFTLLAPELGKNDTRLNFARSGLKEAEFVPVSVTVEGQTRQGILVPAPGKASWTVEIPANAFLEFGAALLDPAGPGEPSDGAGVELWLDETKLWSSTLQLNEDFQDVRLSLAQYTGSHTLSFRSSPGSTPVRDYAVFTNPTLIAPTDPAPRHIILVGVDTLRADALGLNGYPKATSTALDAWAANAVVFEDALAPAPRTRPSFRTAVTGKYPLEAVSAPVIAEYFAKAGFRTAGFAANVHLVPRFHFNSGFETWVYKNGAKADEQLGKALTWIRAHKDEDFFVFLHLMDPHTFYDAPGSYRDRFVKSSRPANVPELFNRWEIITRLGMGKIGPEEQDWIRARYDGEVAYTSDQLVTFFNEVEKLSTRTLSMVITDHGEEFFEHGGYEHNHSLYQELVRVLLMIRTPEGWGGGPHRVPAPVGLIDVVPTLLDSVGLKIPEGLAGVSLRPFFDPLQSSKQAELTAMLEERPRVLGHMMFNTERWGVVYRGWKYILYTLSGQEELYNLKADPKEQQDRASGARTGSDAEAALVLPLLRQALEKASGWPVRPALRVTINDRGPFPFELVFESPILEAGVIDPEAGRSTRANLEWGEKPEFRVEDVAELQLSEDKKTVLVTPKSQATRHTLYVACESLCPPAKLVTRDNGGDEAILSGISSAGRVRLTTVEGTILLQRLTEAESLELPVAGSQLDALKELGYIED